MKSLKVLLLEDQPFQMKAMRQMLGGIGIANVIVADGVQSATRLLAEHGDVDIAICDLHMNGADGIDFIRYLGEIRCMAGLIIVSRSEASVLASVARMARDVGLTVLGCLEKPASSLRFRLLIESFLEQRRLYVPPGACLEKRVTEEEVTAALREKQLLAHFQPKVTMSGSTVGVEALVRWPHSTRGVLSPAQFLPVIESAGLGNELMWYMMENALDAATRLHLPGGSALSVAVNVSPDVLQQPDFSRRVLAMLDERELTPETLTLEIVESAFSSTSSVRLESLARLRMSGCKVAIDDFGTGFSNLQRLLELPVSDLKIPSEFVKGVGREANLSAVVEGALIMAARMGLDVTVEGVETREDFEALSLLGEPFVQGYFVARPMSEQNLAQWLVQYPSWIGRGGSGH